MIYPWPDRLRGPRVTDAAAVLLSFTLSVPGSVVSSPEHRVAGLPWWPGVLVSGVACALLWWRRRRPVIVVIATTACVVVAGTLGYLLTPLLLAPVMTALYSLAMHATHRTTVNVAFGIAVLLAVTELLAVPTYPLLWRAVSPPAWILLSAAHGLGTRMRRDYVEAIRTRAEHAEHTREEEARHRVAEERMRIARELHDVVAHHLALANAQAGVVGRLLRTRPDQAEKLLSQLTGTTSSALRELKATVGLLRQADDPDAPLEPAPGLARLPELTSSFAAAGLTVTVVTEGPRRPLSPGADLAAFRIVQEALTNVTKHAATSEASVRLGYFDDRLTVTISDDGPARDPSTAGANSGFGLIGMRERAQSADGRLRAGKRPGGGFEVVVELPLYAAKPEEEFAS